MIEPLGESAIVRGVAQAACKRIANDVIAALQDMRDTLSGDDSVLTTTWDEICVQVQHEESFFWGTYDETVRGIVAGHVAKAPKYEQQAIWLQTDAGIDWSLEEPEDRETYPVVDCDIVDYLVKNYVYARAADFSNVAIDAYLARSTMTDDP